MINIIEVETRTTEKIAINHFWVIRGIKDDGTRRTCIVESDEFEIKPTHEQVTQFLIENPEVDFAVVSERYSATDLEDEFEDDLAFLNESM